MNKAASVKLSLRKLFIATLAIGPLAILPSPLWAVPTTAQYAVTNGSATLVTGAGTATFTVSDRTVLVWTGNDASANNTFTIPTGETWTFGGLSTTGAVLNKVGYNTNGTTNGLATANITGNLNSTGKVFILANGNIVVNSGATVDTAGGLILSTLNETSDFNFTTQGNLSFSGAASGTIALGNTTAAVSVTTGSLSAWASAVTVNNVTVAGDFVVNQTGSTTAFLPSTAITSLANVSVTVNNAVIGNSTGLWTVANGTTTLNTGGNKVIDVSNAANNFGTIAVFAGNGTGGNVTIADANNITLAASTVGQDLTVTAVGAGNGTAVGTSGALTIGGNAIVTTTSGNSNISLANNSTVAGTLNLTTTNSSITFNGLGNINMGTTTATPTATGNRNSISITTNGILTVGNTIIAAGNTTAGGSVSLTGSNIVQTAAISGGNATNWGSVSMNASTGNITLTSTTVLSNQTISLNASSGSVSAATTPITTGNGTGTSSIKTSASGTADLSSATNAFATGQVIQFTGGSANISNTLASVVGTTNATGNYTFTDGAAAGVVLGTGTGTAGQNITVGGILTITANNAAGVIIDNAYTAFNVFGAVNLTSGGSGAITLNAARANGSLAPSVFLGAISASTTGPVSLAETTTLNVGTVTGSTVALYSTLGNIIETGNITSTTSTTATVPTSGSITLNSANNVFTALTLTGGTDGSATSNGASVSIVGGGTAPGNLSITTPAGKNVSLGALTASNLTVNSGGLIATTGTVNGANVTLNSTSTAAGSITLSNPVNATNATLVSAGPIDLSGAISAGNLTLTTTSSSATSISQTVGAGVSGNTTVTSSGNVALGSGNDFASVTINTVGDTVINDVNNLTIAGNTGGLLTAKAGGTGATIASTWNLSLGNLSVNSLAATAANGGGGNSGTVTQVAGSTLHVENQADVVTNFGNIVIANAGNSAGRVQLSTGAVSGTGGNASITYTEDSTVKLGTIANSAGNVSITSRTGSIIEDPNAAVVIATHGTMTLNATNGSIIIGNTSHTTGTTTGNVVTFVATAPSGSVTLNSSASTLTLSTINANSLTVTASGNIAQSNPISVYGTTNITSTGQNVTLTNNSNNFGPIIISTGGVNKNISINESGTLNLRTVTMAGGGNGTFTATSVNGDIISSGFGGVRPGGTIASPGTGVVTLAATKGNITVGDATTDFPTTGGVVFNGNNVSLTVLGNSTLTLGANATTSVASNLTVTTAIGSVANAGNIVVSGNASFTTGNGNISLNQSGDQFGTLKFSGNQVSIIQSNDMKLLTGSSAIGASSLASGGSISIVNVGGSASFGSTLSLIATGNITLPKLIQVGNTLTVNAAGTKDLSALSISGDLSSKTPVNLGTGAYLAPQH